MKRSENRLILYNRSLLNINKPPIDLHRKFLVMDKCILFLYKVKSRV